jgi:hypothetical protein
MYYPQRKPLMTPERAARIDAEQAAALVARAKADAEYRVERDARNAEALAADRARFDKTATLNIRDAAEVR